MQRASYLLLDSRDRILSKSPSTSDVTFELDTAFNVKSINCLSFILPLSQYNVIANQNNRIVFSDMNGTHTVDLVQGNYTIIQLLVQVANTMNAASAGMGYAATYDDILYKITITATSNFELLFSNTLYSIATTMGFNPVDTGLALLHLSDNSIQLSLPLSFFCRLDEAEGLNVKSSNDQDHGTFYFINPQNGGDFLIWTERAFYEQRANISQDNIQALNVSFFDYNNTPVSFNGVNWQMGLKLNYDF